MAEAPGVPREALAVFAAQVITPVLVQDAFVPHLPLGYRKRVLPIERVFFALLQFVLMALPSFGALVDALRSGAVHGVAALTLTVRAFELRLKSLPHTAFLAVLSAVTKAMPASPVRSWVRDLAPFASGMFAIDDTTLDALARKIAALASHEKGSPATLGGRLGAALDLTTGKLAAVLYDADAAANEKNHLLPLIEQLEAGVLVVFDLGYFAFHLFDAISEHFVYWVTRLREKITFEVVATLADRPLYRDRIINLGVWRSDRAAYPVRLVELQISGVWHSWLTNVLDPRMLPAPNVMGLYALRWTIEQAFAAIKRALGLAYLRACHENGVLIQVWCTLCVYQVLQHLRLTIAAAEGWDADRVSWVRLVRYIGLYAAQLQTLPLEEYLKQPHLVGALVKRGTRVRRQVLPAAVRASCLPPPALPPNVDLNPRTARCGKPAVRKRNTVRAVAGLTNPNRGS